MPLRPPLLVEIMFLPQIDELYLAGVVLLGMQKLNRGFSQLRDTELDNKTQTIITALTGNAAFPTPNPPLATITTALTAFQDALAMPAGTDARAAALAPTRAALEALLQQIAGKLAL